MNAKQLSLLLLLAVPAFAAAPKELPAAKAAPVTKTQPTVKAKEPAPKEVKIKPQAPKGRHHAVKTGSAPR